MVSVRLSSKLEASGDFFLRRIEWHPKKIVFILRILEKYAISLGKKKTNKQRSHKSFLKVYQKTHERTCAFLIKQLFHSRLLDMR